MSIIIPAYNEARYLPGCLDAIAKQTMMPDEVIVVDNNSTDGTAKIAESYPFVRVIHEPRLGIVFARNAGFDAARGMILARIDADTLLPRNWVERVRSFYRHPENQLRALTGSGEFYNLRTGRFTGRIYSFIIHRGNRLLLGYHFPWGSNSALPKGCWLAVRNEVLNRTDVHEDLDLGIALAERHFQTTFQPTLCVRVVARRILDHHAELWGYLAMWPRTVRMRSKACWPVVWIMATLVWLGSYGVIASEKILSFVYGPY